MGMQTAPAQLFYDFCLDDHVPEDHLLRRIDRFLDLEKVRTELKPFRRAIISNLPAAAVRRRSRDHVRDRASAALAALAPEVQHRLLQLLHSAHQRRGPRRRCDARSRERRTVTGGRSLESRGRRATTRAGCYVEASETAPCCGSSPCREPIARATRWRSRSSTAVLSRTRRCRSSRDSKYDFWSITATSVGIGEPKDRRRRSNSRIN
jgi:hypothetical protein